MTRELIPYRPNVSLIQGDLPSESTLIEWLQAQAATPSWILAHALDGVIWGWADARNVRTAPEISPPLRLNTLQQLRLFNADYEVKLWRGIEGWHAIHITDEEDPTAAAIDEQQLLWGTQATLVADDFMWLQTGAQGLQHVMPLYPSYDDSEALKNALLDHAGEYDMGVRADKSIERMCLKLRHYLTENEIGVNSIALSRLTGLGVVLYE